MPMFDVRKPKQFHYQPRFYDPEKEKWENLKKKYAYRDELNEKSHDVEKSEEEKRQDEMDAELAYFEQRVRESYNHNRQTGKLAKRTSSKKRKSDKSDSDDKADLGKRIRIKRRFDNSQDDYLQPVPARKILLYTLLILLLLYFVFVQW